MKRVRLTLRAEARLAEIAAWTFDRFGPAQASAYEAELLRRIDALTRAEAVSRPCAALLPGSAGARDLRYIRAGRHYLIFVERAEAIVILDFVHASRNLEKVLADLARNNRLE